MFLESYCDLCCQPWAGVELNNVTFGFLAIIMCITVHSTWYHRSNDLDYCKSNLTKYCYLALIIDSINTFICKTTFGKAKAKQLKSKPVNFKL